MRAGPAHVLAWYGLGREQCSSSSRPSPELSTLDLNESHFPAQGSRGHCFISQGKEIGIWRWAVSHRRHPAGEAELPASSEPSSLPLSQAWRLLGITFQVRQGNREGAALKRKSCDFNWRQVGCDEGSLRRMWFEVFGALGNEQSCSGPGPWGWLYHEGHRFL